jgi:hypothetical protein
MPSVPILEINCFVQGDGASQVFSVEIANNKPVSALRKAIKEEKQVALEHVDADALRLWKVSIPVDKDFEDSVNKLELKDEEELSPVKRLSILDEPQDGHLHVVVRSPLTGEFVLFFSLSLYLTVAQSWTSPKRLTCSSSAIRNVSQACEHHTSGGHALSPG